MDLKGKHLIIAARCNESCWATKRSLKCFSLTTKILLQYRPFCYIHPHEKFRQGVVNMLESISKAYHFNYTWIEPPDGFYGSKLSIGSWNGMMIQRERGEVDASSLLTITYPRLTIADFSTRIFKDYVTGLYKIPDFLLKLFFFNVLAFNCKVWVMFFLSLRIIILVPWMSNNDLGKTIWFIFCNLFHR